MFAVISIIDGKALNQLSRGYCRATRPEDQGNDREDNVMKLFSVYVFPLFLFLFGVGALIFSFITKSVEPSDLSEVRGYLVSYEIVRDSKGRYPRAVLTLDKGQRVATTELDEDSADKLFKDGQSYEIRTFVPTQPTAIPDHGGLRTYGLSVNGQQIESRDDEIWNENFVFRYVFPALGVLFIVLALYVFVKSRNKYAME